MKKLGLFVMVVSIIVGSQVATANLVYNGTFDDGLNGWNQSANWYAGTTVAASATPAPNARSDDPAGVISFGAAYSAGGIYQIIGVAPGTTVQISADWCAEQPGYGWVEVGARSWDGVSAITDYGYDTLIGGGNPNQAWTTVSKSYLVTTNMLVISLGGGNGGNGAGYRAFDNIVVTPEPATMLMLGLGGLLLRRRRRA